MARTRTLVPLTALVVASLAVAAAGEWTFPDGVGGTVALDEVPTTIAAQSVAAGALWDYGVRVDGVFGPLRRGDGSPDPALGRADPDAFESLGEIDSEINIKAVAALRPDVIVTAAFGPDRFWGIADGELEQMRAIAPVIAIRLDDRPLDKPLARFAALAESVGASPKRVAKAKAAFADASGALTGALDAKPGLAVVAASGTPAEMYIASPPAFPDLRYYQGLGMDLAEPASHPTSGGYWETLSWEQAGKYPADLILADARGGTLEQILALLPDTARKLPAVEAGRITTWPAVTAYGYRNFADVLRDLTTVVEDASPDVD